MAAGVSVPGTRRRVPPLSSVAPASRPRSRHSRSGAGSGSATGGTTVPRGNLGADEGDCVAAAHREGVHQCLDIAMHCGTRLFSALRGRVVDPRSAGSLGPSYGAHAFRIRNHRFHVDLVFGHTRRVFVRPGELVRRGERIALASDMGAPDGCHLHFEVRPPRAGYQEAVNPRERLHLRAVD